MMIVCMAGRGRIFVVARGQGYIMAVNRLRIRTVYIDKMTSEMAVTSLAAKKVKL